MRESNFASELQERILQTLGVLRPPTRSDTAVIVYTTQKLPATPSPALGAGSASSQSHTPNTPNLFSTTPTPQYSLSVNSTPSPTLSAAPAPPLAAYGVGLGSVATPGSDGQAAQPASIRRLDPFTLLEDFDGPLCPTAFGGEKIERSQLRYAASYL